MGEDVDELVAFGEALGDVLGEGVVLGALLQLLHKADGGLAVRCAQNHAGVVFGHQVDVLCEVEGPPAVFLFGLVAQVFADLLDEFLRVFDVEGEQQLGVVLVLNVKGDDGVFVFKVLVLYHIVDV